MKKLVTVLLVAMMAFGVAFQAEAKVTGSFCIGCYPGSYQGETGDIGDVVVISPPPQVGPICTPDGNTCAK